MAQATLENFNQARAVTKSDTLDIPLINGLGPKALWVGGAGIVAGVFEDASVVEFTCVAGTLLPVALKRVNSSNTTATLTVALYQV